MPFSAVNSGLGDTPRNFARLFGAWQMDLAVRRDFPIGERLKLQFRAEAFNVFNHPNFGNINPYFGTEQLRSGHGYACEFAGSSESAVPNGRPALNAVRAQISVLRVRDQRLAK